MIHLICPNPALDRTILVEEFYLNKPIRPLKVRDFPGGKGFNVAYSLKDNDENNYIIHTILGGGIGDYVAQLNEKLDHKLVVTKNNKNTRICSIYVEEKSKDTFLIYEKGLELTNELYNEFTRKLETSIKDGDIVVFSGSLMKGMPTNYIQHIVDKYKNVKVIVDTSGEALEEVYKTKPYFLKINNEELKELYPEINEDSEEDIIDVLKNKTHLENIIITLGAKGSLAKIGKDLYKIVNPKIDVKNPIASGDFYLGVLVKGLLNEENPLQFLKEASAYATANCLEYFPYVDKNKLEFIEKKVLVEKI